jgi:hypothetical protein
MIIVSSPSELDTFPMTGFLRQKMSRSYHFECERDKDANSAGIRVERRSEQKTLRSKAEVTWPKLLARGAFCSVGSEPRRCLD